MILKNALVVANATHLSCDTNTVQLTFDRESLENTTWCSEGGKTYQAGLMDVSGSFEGFWNPTVEDVLRGLNGTPATWTISPSVDTGSPVFVFNGPLLDLSQGASVGELVALSGTFAHSAALTRGTVLGALKTSSTATTTPGVELGAIAAGSSKRLMLINTGTVAVTAVTQSSATNGWSSPAQRDTRSVAAGSIEIVTVTTVNTNTWWRISASSSGASNLIALAI